MKHKFISLLLAGMVLLQGCTYKTPYGECIGAFDKEQAEKENPNLIYRLSAWNLILGAVFFEVLFVPPILVLKDATFCPEGIKKVKEIKVDEGPNLIHLTP
jgi:hypothetical protein